MDVLMIPVGGEGYTIDSSAAQKIISQIEPKIVIPMHYALPKQKVELDDVSKFLKTMGKNSVAPQDKFVVKDFHVTKRWNGNSSFAAVTNDFASHWSEG